MGATDGQSNWAETRKTLVKTGVFERRGQEPNNLQIPWEKRGFQNEATQNPTRAAKHSVRCLLHARAAALSWTLNRLLAHPHITGSFTR
jgi:hypothetical protein